MRKLDCLFIRDLFLVAITQGMLPWQQILGAKSTKLAVFILLHWHSEAKPPMHTLTSMHDLLHIL